MTRKTQSFTRVNALTPDPFVDAGESPLLIPDEPPPTLPSLPRHDLSPENHTSNSYIDSQ